MPVAQQESSPAKLALIVGLGGLMGLLSILFVVTQADRLFGGDTISFSVGEQVFPVGETEELAVQIDENGGGGLLLPDPSPGGDTDIVFAHVGDDPERGWFAFAARPPTSPRDCFVEWVPDREVYADTCDGAEYPPNGEGLTQYLVEIDAEGNVAVDLGVVARPGPDGAVAPDPDEGDSDSDDADDASDEG
ncbi:MAG: hypothetical protein AAF467_06980 [Actinomycetota bacterium]